MEEGDINVVRELFEEIMADALQDPRKLMYVSTHEKNPVVDLGIRYTRGERIYEENVLKRACIQHADKVIIKGSQDSDTFFAAEAVVALNPDIDVTVWVIDYDNVQRFHRLKGRVDVIHPLTAQMLCQNMQDKIYFPLQSLLTNKQGQEIYMVRLPEDSQTLDIEKLQPQLRQQYGILLWAIQRNGDPDPIVNPMNVTLPGSTRLWIIAEQRPVNIDWQALAG
jgi:Trk K+ transport system NAD-binding subunit